MTASASAVHCVVEDDVAKALESFAKANRVKPYSRDLVATYAATLAQSGKPDEGIALVNDMLAHDKTWGPATISFSFNTRAPVSAIKPKAF